MERNAVLHLPIDAVTVHGKTVIDRNSEVQYQKKGIKPSEAKKSYILQWGFCVGFLFFLFFSFFLNSFLYQS